MAHNKIGEELRLLIMKQRFRNVQVEPSHERQWKNAPRASRERVLWLCRQAVGERVLDLGCGSGFTSILLAKEGFQVLGVDFDEEAIGWAVSQTRQERRSVQERLDFSVADLTSFKPEGEVFDTVILGHVLNEFICPDRVLEVAHRSLAQGGALVLSVPFGHSLNESPVVQKRVFFVGSLVLLVSRRFELEKLRLGDGSLLCTATRRDEKISPQLEKSQSSILAEWLLHEEKEFCQRELKLLNSHGPIDSDEGKIGGDGVDKGHEKASTIPERELELLKEDKQRLLEESRRARVLEQKAKRRATEAEKRAQELRAELSRTVSQSAIRFKVGTAFYDASQSPRDLLLLPWRLLKLYRVYRNRLRHQREVVQKNRAKSKPQVPSAQSESTEQQSEEKSARRPKPSSERSSTVASEDAVLFLAVNGGGLGHLTRCLAVARKLRRRSPTTKIIFLTTSYGLKVIEEQGFDAYYFPPKVYRPAMTAEQWNRRFATTLGDLLIYYKPSILVFDGVSIYQGLRRCLEQQPGISAVWIARGNWKEPADWVEKVRRSVSLFEAVVLPGEALAAGTPTELKLSEATWKQKVIAVAPILLLDRRDLLPREKAAEQLGIQAQGFNVLLQLGAGNINPLQELIQNTIHIVRSVHPGARIFIAESPIANESQVTAKATGRLNKYPLSLYLKSFDLLVSASGYNSFTEAVAFGIPTIFVPNTRTITDDQIKRAKRAEARGLGAVAHPFDEGVFKRSVRRLTNAKTGAALERRSLEAVPRNGADQVAETLEQWLPEDRRNRSALIYSAEAVRKAQETHEPPRVAAVVDEFTFRCFAPEARMLNLHAEHWRRQVEEHDPQFLFVESTWRGQEGSWRKRLESLVKGARGPLVELVAYCRGKGLPTVFWNKDDPPNFEIFLEAARFFDFVFTTAETCVPRYREALGHNRIFTLPFAAQPRLHNPVGSRCKDREIGFAGSWHRRYPERQRQMEWILKPAFKYGLDIFDRMHGSNSKSRRFPEAYQPFIKGFLPYDILSEEYKRYKIFLNVNTVTEDPTMCARRVFEVLATGTALVSSPSTAIENLLGGCVALSSDRQQTEGYLGKLLGSCENRERLEHRAVREVLSQHTYAERFAEILKRIGLSPPPRHSVDFVVAVVLSKDPRFIDRHMASLLRQKTKPGAILILAQGSTLGDLWRSRVDQLPVTTKILVSNAQEDFKESLSVQALRASRAGWWTFIIDGHNYGRNYLEDLILATNYSYGDVVGKSVYQMLEKGDIRILSTRPEAREFEYGTPVLVGASLFRRSVVERLGLPDDHLLQTSFDYGVDSGEFFVYAADRFSHLVIVSPAVSVEEATEALDAVEIDDRLLWPLHG